MIKYRARKWVLIYPADQRGRGSTLSVVCLGVEKQVEGRKKMLCGGYNTHEAGLDTTGGLIPR